ncbi:MAG: hypothetical protein ABIQ02_05040 [Saprospiraceae bacterium]
MQEINPDQLSRPGIPEALDPDLGNGALWESIQDLFILKSVDPLKQLDHLLLEESSAQQIIDKWNGIEELASVEVPPDLIDQPIFEQDPSSVNSEDETIISPESIEKTPEAGWQADNSSIETESEIQSSPPIEELIEPIVNAIEPSPKKAEKAGKRVRKVVKKAQKESPVVELTVKLPTYGLLDSQLSPYTQWLKSLRGSEYVHPYEDDYGLEHLSATARGGVSETFAELLASQGYHEQAIEMYKQLMEKYPEKSSFFAAKIEALT